MSELLVPGHYARRGDPDGGPFNREFFAAQFREGETPRCVVGPENAGPCDIPVVELELINGQGCEIYCFEAFKKDVLVAEVFVDPPDSEEVYLSFIRYETIFRVNIRFYCSPERKLGFRAHKPVIEEEVEE